MKTLRRDILTACIGSALAAAPAWAETPDPYEKPNNTWISISGEVDAVSPNAFTLDYDDGLIIVEMDDGDRDADGYKLMKGDKVTVDGKIDDDFFETTTIEASSVFVQNIGTRFFASPIDEEDRFVSTIAPIVGSTTVVQGQVTGVSDDTFTIDSDTRQVKVDVGRMTYNPLDDEGYQKIEVGDRVSVIGTMDVGLFEGREFNASTVLTLSDS